MSAGRHAVIVGGGIGGLATAVGLRLAGWTVTVLERGHEQTEIGAGISLMDNALRALEALGFSAELAKTPAPPAAGSLRTSTGKVLNTFANDTPATSRMLVLHRAELHRMLRGALPACSLRHGVSVTDVTTHQDGAAVLAEGEWLQADLVVGADGVGSMVRTKLWPAHPGPVYSGSTAWRAVGEAPAGLVASDTLGEGREFGVLPLPGGRVYWFGTTTGPAHQQAADERAVVLRLFRHWPAPIPELIRATPAEAVLHHDLTYLATPLPSFVSGRVGLLGDAAHAMTPHLGQGGCQTLEDAVELAAALGELPVLEALRRYDARRRPRTQRVVRNSARMGRIVRLRNPLAVAARDLLIRAMPRKASAKRAARALEWTPPVISGSNSVNG